MVKHFKKKDFRSRYYDSTSSYTEIYTTGTVRVSAPHFCLIIHPQKRLLWSTQLLGCFYSQTSREVSTHKWTEPLWQIKPLTDIHWTEDRMEKKVWSRVTWAEFAPTTSTKCRKNGRFDRFYFWVQLLKNMLKCVKWMFLKKKHNSPVVTIEGLRNKCQKSHSHHNLYSTFFT